MATLTFTTENAIDIKAITEVLATVINDLGECGEMASEIAQEAFEGASLILFAEATPFGDGDNDTVQITDFDENVLAEITLD